MNWFERLIVRVCTWICSTFPGRYRLITVNGEPYLGRFYVKHNGLFPGVYLHRFFKSDGDRELHSHPWKWSTSFILAGMYFEERATIDRSTEPKAPDITLFVRERWSLNRLTQGVFHRVLLKDEKAGAWTLFFSGPETDDWGFLCRKTGVYTDHATFLGERFNDVAPSRDRKLQSREAELLREISRLRKTLDVVHDHLIVLEPTLTVAQIGLCPINYLKWEKQPEWNERHSLWEGPNGDQLLKMTLEARKARLTEMNKNE